MGAWKRTLYAIWFTQFTAMIGFCFVYPFLAYFIQTLGVTDLAQVALWSGLCTAATPVTLAFASPLWGLLADRYGRKPMLIRASAAGAATVLAMFWVTEVWQVVALRALQGFFSGTVAASTTLLASAAPDEERGRALGSLQTWILLGATAGPLIGGVLAEKIGYRLTFLSGGICLAISTVAVVLLVHEEFHPAEQVRGISHRGWSGAIRQFVPAGGMVLTIVAALFLTRAATNTVSPVLPLLIQELLGGSARAAIVMGIASAAGGIGGAIGAPIFGGWGDRFGHQRMLIASTLGAALFYLPQYFAPDAAMLVVWQLLSGVCVGGTLSTGIALLAQHTTRGHEGAIFGLDASSASAAGALGPLIGAAVAATTSIRAPFLVTSIMLVAGALIIAVLLGRAGPGGPKDAQRRVTSSHSRLGGITISRD